LAEREYRQQKARPKSYFGIASSANEPGKRSFDSDIDLYLSENDILKAKKTFSCSDINLPSYNMLIQENVEAQG